MRAQKNYHPIAEKVAGIVLAFLLNILLFGCGKSEPKGGYVDLPRDDLSLLKDRYDELVTRARGFIVNNQVGVKTDGNLAVEGDSLLWSGLGMGVLPCGDAEILLRGLAASADKREGAFVRMEPLREDQKGDEVSRDGVTGVMFGFTQLKRRCPALVPEVQRVWKNFRAFVDTKGKGAVLYPGTTTIIMPAFKFTMDLTSWVLDQMGRPSEDSLVAFEGGNIVSAIEIRNRKSACYPIHLATLQIATAQFAGRPISNLGKNAFCEQTDGMDIPLTDWFCGRSSATIWLRDTFKVDQWQFRHQRCGSWETPDGHSNASYAAMDWLEFYTIAQGG